jgi:penicillin-binding protein 1A
VPIWVDFMREALRGVPETRRPAPDGIVEVKINGHTGGTRDADIDPVFEYFRVDKLPTEEGYVGDMGPTPQDIDPNSPDTPQSGSEPIF